MKLTVKPEEVIVKPPIYKVEFHEGDEYPDYVGGGTWETMNDLRPDINDWLNENAPGWKAEFDRGDWGEGVAFVSINFTAEDHAKAFVKQFETLPCPNSKTRGDCPHMGKAIAIAKERKDGKAACPNCARPIQILNKYNQEEFIKNNEQ
jgi:hypothetical protein